MPIRIPDWVREIPAHIIEWWKKEKKKKEEEELPRAPSPEPPSDYPDPPNEDPDDPEKKELSRQ